MNFQTLDKIGNVKDKRVLVRVDFNIPLGNDKVVNETEAFRLEVAVPTIEYLVKAGARVILVSHLGDGTESLKPVAEYWNKTYQIQLGFIPDITGEMAKQAVQGMPGGKVILLENLRFNKGEEGNDLQFAKDLVSLAEMYVLEAFPASHRKHASIVGVPALLPSYAGIQFAREVEGLSVAMNPKHPFVLLLGGAKFGTKLDLLKKLLPSVDSVVLGGALTHPLLKARGIEIGKSLVDTKVDVSFLDTPKVLIPDHVTVLREGVSGAVPIENVKPTDIIMDIATEGNKHILETIQNAQMILWNGPFGNYEAGFGTGTEWIATAVANTKATSVVGGGDTVTVIRQKKLEDKFTFLSTGGGAMLDFLIEGTLPGIEALEHSKG